MSTTRAKSGVRVGSKRTLKPPAPIESYSDARIAEFLLSNAVDASDYARAVKLVRKMGIDPESVDHDKPIGVR